MICQSCKRNKAAIILSTQNICLCEICYHKEKNRKEERKETKIKRSPFLEKYGKNISDLALEGKIDPVIGREKEIELMIETLNRRNKNNPVLIGEPGVGKTAIAEGLAVKIIERNVPEKLENKIVYTLDLTAVLAGTTFRGQFEERMKKLVKELEEREDILLFIDEIHMIVGAGAAGGMMDAGNILKPALAREKVQIIGATTLNEYRKIENDGALERRFQPIIVEEPTEDAAFEILKGIRKKYEDYHQVIFSDEVLRACVTLSNRYIQDRNLPDKAIDLLDMLGSKTNLKKGKRNMDAKIRFFNVLKEKAMESRRYEDAMFFKQRETELINDTKKLKLEASIEDLNLILEKKTGIPVQELQMEKKEKMKKIEENLGKRIIGQTEAVQKVAQAVKRNWAGMKPKNRPIASFLFSGPTGVGKTELTKVLADELFGTKDSMIRIDMSEYMEKHSVSKLIGSPPGYVGYEDAGQLTEKVRRNPYSILLLDEMEKAHPDVQNIFLQILDDGHLTDSRGRKVDFKNTIIIATTNAGEEKNKAFVGFQKQEETENILTDLKPYFKPELLNRFDQIIRFHHLGNKELEKIFELQFDDLKKELEKQKLHIEVSKELKEKVIIEGYNPAFGARPLRRAIQKWIENPLADFLLEEDAGEILLFLSNNQVKCKKEKSLY